MRSRGRLWLALWPVTLGAGAGTLALVLASNHEGSRAATSALLLLLGWSFSASGLVAWSRRPDNRTGALMVAVGFTWFLAALAEANASLVYTLGLAFGAVPLAVFIHLLLAFPNGRVEGSWDRAIVAGAYPAALLANATSLLVDATPDESCKKCPPNAFLVGDSHTTATVLQTFWNLVGVGFMAAVAVIVARRWRAASGPARRVLTPVYIGGLASVLLVGLGFALDPLSSGASNVLGLFGVLTFGSVPFLFLAVLLRTRLARTGAIQLLQETPDVPSVDEAQAGLRRALNDPTLRLLLRAEDGGGYLDAGGESVDLPEETPDAAVSRILYEGRPIAAVVHDHSLRDEQPELLADVLAAARVALVKDQSVEALRASERRNRALLDAIPDNMFRIRGDGTFVDFHAHDADELQLAPERIVGSTVADAIGPDLVPEVMDVIRRVIATGESEVYEQAVERGGALVHSEARVVKSGEDEVLAIVRDITARKAAQEALVRQRDFLRTVVNAATTIFCVVTVEGRIVRFNDFCAELTGRPDDERARGLFFWELFPAPQDADAVRRAFEADDGRTYEHRWLSASGERLLVSWSSTSLVDESGAERRLLHGVDVTESKRQEEELRQQYDFLSAVGRATPSLLTVVEADGQIGPRGVNASFTQVMGYDDDVAIGRPLWELVAPGDADPMRAALAEAFPGGSVVEHESIWTTSAGEPISVSWSIRPIGELAGRPSYLVCGVDVTEQKRQQEEIRKSRARIVEAGDAERRRLERNLHDGAQQRLVALSLALRLAQAKVASDVEGASEILSGSAIELALALEELRELARGIHPAVLSDRGLVAALDALAARATFPVELAAVPDERLPDQIEAAAYYVVSEALANASKYAQATAARVSVTCGDGAALVEVADDGVGGADPGAGTGLRGLRDRVEALDGRLEVESPAGGGTSIRARIPLGAPPEAVAPGKSAAEARTL